MQPVSCKTTVSYDKSDTDIETAKPVTDSELGSNGSAKPGTESEQEANVTAQLDTNSEPVGNGSAEPVTESEAVGNGSADPVTESEPVVNDSAKPLTESEPVSSVRAHPVTQTDSEPVVKVTTKPVTEAEPVMTEIVKTDDGSEKDGKPEEPSPETDPPPKKKRKYQKRSVEPPTNVTPGRRSGRAVQKTEVFNVPPPKSKKDSKPQTPKSAKSDLNKTNDIINNVNSAALDPTESAEALAEKEREMKSDPEYMDIDPAADATRNIDPALLLPFKFGWTREISFRQVKSGSSTSDVYYWPPPDKVEGKKRRKRRSKLDVERYFDEVPSKYLTKDNFVFNKIMGLNNEEYECVRYAKSMPQYENMVAAAQANRPARKSLVPGFQSQVATMKAEFVGDFDDEMPITLQLAMGVTQLRQEHEKRRQNPDRASCPTPPLAEDMPWSFLDDDPLGVYTEMGGRSNPATPPPLRAVKVTYNSTVKQVEAKIKEIKASLADSYEYAAEQAKEDLELKENLASHDASIKKSAEEPDEETAEETTEETTELTLIGDENRTS